MGWGSQIVSKSGYWDTRDNTIVCDGNEFIAARVNNNGIAIFPIEGIERTIEDISNSGIFVGGEHDFDGDYWYAVAVVWNEGLAGSSTVLAGPADYNWSMARRISSNGNIIAGYASYVSKNGTIPIMWDAERNLVLLPTVSGASTP
jgi:uncharacterized membrane protein